MKIAEIQIYGYGKLENIKLTNGGGINVYYGINETGKSTIMSFIHSILFGFPTKQQSELRYEPKKGAKYGGQLIVDFPGRGKAVIERVKGRAIGDVHVLLEDGTRGGEELLKELLHHIDKSLFQSIFSFNLQGLQNVNQLKNEDLGKFLFSTGALGSDRLFTVETSLNKELELLFKPNGKKPLINEKLEKLREVHMELKKAERNNDQYSQLLKEHASLLAKIKETQGQLGYLKNRILQLEEWERVLPAVNERNALLVELKDTGPISFPVDGIERLNQLEQILKPVQGQMKALEERLSRLQIELKDIRPDEALLRKEPEVFEVIESAPLYDTLEQQRNEWHLKLSHIVEEIEELKSKLHLTEDRTFSNSNTSIYMKEKTLEAQRKQYRLAEKKSELDDQFNREKVTLENIEEQLSHLKQQLMPLEERNKLKERVFHSQNELVTQKELENLSDKIQFVKEARQKEKQRSIHNKKRSRFQFAFIVVLLTLMIAWGFLNTQWIFTGLGALGLIMVLFFFNRSDRAESDFYKNELDALLVKQEKLQRQLQETGNSDVSFIKQQLDKDQAIEEEIHKLTVKWEQQNGQYDKIIQSYENWEREHIEHQELLLSFGKELNLPEDISLNQIHDAYLVIENLKKLTREKQHIVSHLETYKTKMNTIDSRVHVLAKEFLPNRTTARESVLQLRTRLKEEHEKQIKYNERLNQLKEIQNQLENCKIEYEHLNNEKSHLFEAANTADEEQFRIIGKAVENRARLLKRLEQLDSHINQSSLNEDNRNQFSLITNSVEEMTGVKEQVIVNETQLSLLQEQAAEVKHQITLLEEGGTYADLFHTFTQLKSEFEVEAKNWARLALAKDILNKTVTTFKNERLPLLLEKAEEFLSFLTGGEYIKILPNETYNGFLIQTKDAVLFAPNELSQATTEQVYVSLRFALAVTVYKKYQLPIIIDDSFVNFDHQRTEKIISLLRTFKENQILFFTCHQHLLRLFSEQEIIMLKDKIQAPIHS